MNDERLLVLMLTALGVTAGSALLMRERMTSPELWYEIHWPNDVDEDSVTAFFRTLAGDRSSSTIGLEVITSGGVLLRYRLGLSRRQAPSAIASLRSFVPGTEVTLIANDMTPAPLFAWTVQVSSRLRPLRSADAASIARGLIAALTTSAPDETIILQWLLGPRLSPQNVAQKPARPIAGVLGTAKALLHGTSEMSNDERKALVTKVGDAGFRAIGRIAVAGAGEKRAVVLASRVTSALRAAEAPGVSVSVKRSLPDEIARASVPRDWPLSLNVSELTALTAFPLGDSVYKGVRGDTAAVKPAPASSSRRSPALRTVGESTHPASRDVGVGLSATDALQHLHVLGPTGVGKSTLLLNLILQDIDAGRGVVVIDPKGDLVGDVLTRVPLSRYDDVVVLDPSDDQRPVGINVMGGRDGTSRGAEGQGCIGTAETRSPELIADQVLAVFHGLYADNWGPRTQDILHSSLLTLAGRPGMTLCALPVLLSNERFRASVVRGLTDEIALKPFWHWFDSISDGERQQAIAPVMNKLRAFLLRPRMRAVIGQAEPRFDLDDVFTRRRIVLVSLAKGTLGPEAAALLGSLIVSQLWQAALGRVRIPVDRRHPVMVYVDEFQDYLHLPTDLTDVLAQARGLGVGLTLAHQHLAQLPPSMKSAMLANARSRVAFQLGSDDARTIAHTTPGLTPDDFQRLPRFEAYASLVSAGQVEPWASIRTTAPRESSTDAVELRRRSAETYGRNRAEIETDLARLVSGVPTGDGNNDDQPPTIGRRRAS